MNIILAGASGFLGRNLLLKMAQSHSVMALYCQSKDFPDFIKANRCDNVIPVKIDLQKDDEVKLLAEKIGREYDTAIYLAANSDPQVSSVNPALDINSNTISLIHFLSHFRMNRVVYFSSGAVYDGLEGLVSPESRLNPILPYAISKYASEQYIQYFCHKQKSVHEYIIVRFFGAYGPYEPERKIYTKLVKAFGMDRSKTFTVRGDGNNMIDAMYVEDAIEGILRMIFGTTCNVTLDFASCTPLTINELVIKASIFFGIHDVKIIHEGYVPEYINFRVTNNQMRRFYDFKVKTDLDDGLSKMMKFFRKNKMYPTGE
jgi:nucleoside-diphosphate-sugar epimerase